MKKTTSVIIFCLWASTTAAMTITDDTPARSITILKEDALQRVLISPTVSSTEACEHELKEKAKVMKGVVLAALCVPADMTGNEPVEGIIRVYQATH